MSQDIGAQEIVADLLNEIISQTTQTKNIFAGDTITLLVSSVLWNGIWTFDVTRLTQISRLKLLSLYELLGTETDIHFNQHMLVFPAEKRPLHENKTIKDECLKNNDELELIKLPVTEDHFTQFGHRLTDFAILNSTKHLPKPTVKPVICNVGLDIQAPEFMSDMRKIMITLFEYSLSIMSTRPNAKYIFDVIRRKLMTENFFINEIILNKYKHTGATQRRIKFAVNASYDDSLSVNEWLQECHSIQSVDLGIPLTLHVDNAVSVEQELNDLLLLFHQYLRASFKMCLKGESNLEEMGFEDDIRKALRFTGNNVSESVEYLLGNIDSQTDGAKPGLDKAMSPTSDMYRIIMAEPDIIIPLNNTSVLYACLSVIDANSFFVPSVRCPVFRHLLDKILTTYYINKCDLLMHQMLGDISIND